MPRMSLRLPSSRTNVRLGLDKTYLLTTVANKPSGTSAVRIEHCKEVAQHFRDDSLLDDQDLEIINSGGREIHREFVHRD